MIRSLKHSVTIVTLVALGAIFGVGIATVLSAGGGDPIHACANPAGQVRIVTGPGDCKSQETYLTWNVVGPQGPPGVSGYEIVEASWALDPGTANQWQVSCPSGKKVLGGGVSASVSSAVVFGSRPIGDTAWMGEVYNPTHAGTMTVYAVCGFVQ
jgi:hypothetical protein